MDDLKTYINNLRHDFTKKTLDESEVNFNPIIQFETWFKEAVEAKVNEPNAMSLATSTLDGKPSARIVLLRNFDESGFVFYTNYQSRKGEEAKLNSNAALLFFWPELERQIRIEGTLQKISSSLSDEYFNSRPRESRIGALTSAQSKIIANRNVLEEKYNQLNKQYEGKEIPRPEHWGGYLVSPNAVEFWQGRPGRLHDRILYTKENNIWKIVRLAP